MSQNCGSCGMEMRGLRPWHTAWCVNAVEADWPAVTRGKKPKAKPGRKPKSDEYSKPTNEQSK